MRSPAGSRADGVRAEHRELRRVRWQLTAWYVITLCMILLLLGGGLFEVLSNQLAAQLDATLADAARALARTASTLDLRPGNQARVDLAAVAGVRVPGRALYLLRDDGTPLFPDSVGGWVREVAVAAVRTGRLVGDRELDEDRTVRIHAEPFRTRGGTRLIAVAVGNRVEWEDQNAALVAAFAGAAAFAVLLVGVGGYVLARWAMRPIEATFAHMRRFMADAAHELRTPLTVLRTRVEFAIRQPRRAEPDDATLRDIAADSERLGAIVEDLLTLARADARERQAEHRRVFLDDAVADAGSGARVLAQAKGVILEMEQFDEAIVVGDPDRLRQLTAILLDNGIKFTAPGGTVRVRVGTDRARPFLTVEDTGTGIEAAHLPRIFERFFRADPARPTSDPAGRPTSGVGLGLSIARWIADLHHAEIDLRSEVGLGTSITVWFPRGAATPSDAGAAEA